MSKSQSRKRGEIRGETRFIGLGGLAKRLDLSESTIKYFESLGVIPAAFRVEGSRAFRVWPIEMVPDIEQALADHKKFRDV